MSGTLCVTQPAVFRLTLACDLRQVRDAVQTVHQFLAQHGCDAETLAACDLALVEGCNNAVKYALAPARALPVKIEAICEAGQVEFHITDHTPGFEWPVRSKLPDPESENGRGVFLMQSLMNHAKYLRGQDENVLVLRKSRPVQGTAWSEAGHAVPVAHGGATMAAASPVRSNPTAAANDSPILSELELARQIQQSLLLRELPKVHGLEFAGFCQSANQVGGDFYDVVKVSEGTALLMIADVMGKGLAAAMFAAVLRTVLRAMPELAPRPAELLTRVNQLLFEELSSADMFITAQVACLDARKRELKLASAGHCPLLIAGPNGFGVKELSPEGMPLGILPDTAFATEVIELPKECHVLCYTDGLTEAANSRGERYGQERLVSWLRAAGEFSTTEDLKTDLVAALKNFRGHAALNDDQTFVIVRAK